VAGKKAGFVPPPIFQQLTFRRGELVSARFAPDGQTVVYSAAWDGNPMELFAARTDRPESRVFGLTKADVLAISRSGEMLVSLDRHIAGAFIRSGTLAEVGVSGGVAPRELATDVQWADWSPDGSAIAIVREVNQRNQLEYPIGRVIYQTVGWISHPRVSPDGDSVAFLDHPLPRDDGGTVAIVDKAGKKRTLTGAFASSYGLAWRPDGSEIWFTAAKVGANRALHAVPPSGGERLIARVTQSLTVQDVSRDGRALVSHDSIRIGIQGRSSAEEKERELAWLDWSTLFDISADGKRILFSETGEGSGPGYSAYIRGIDGSPPVRLGEGVGLSLSPDGKWAVAITAKADPPQLVLYPTGAGEKKVLPIGKLAVEASAGFLAGGKRMVFGASEPERGTRLFVIDLAGGAPKALTPEGYRALSCGVSPDGKSVVVAGPDRKRYLYPIDGGEPVSIPGLEPEDTPARWSADGRFLYVYRREALPARVFRLEIATGRKELWKELMPADGAGVVDLSPVLPAPDGLSYVYGYLRTLSDLYLLDGVE
jgi:Tol biopolymer transport system component